MNCDELVCLIWRKYLLFKYEVSVLPALNFFRISACGKSKTLLGFGHLQQLEMVLAICYYLSFFSCREKIMMLNPFMARSDITRLPIYFLYCIYMVAKHNKQASKAVFPGII
jgi:hypothetical protein